MTLLLGDALGMLRTLPDESVHSCVTSPPYWGLRDYGTGRWVGGDDACNHVRQRGAQGKSGQRADRTFTAQQVYGERCGKCGAVRADEQIGLEATPALYVERLVAVFREVRRVLRKDGTLWLNLGDTYCTNPRGNREGDLSTSPLTNPRRQDKLWGKHGYRRQAREPRVSSGAGVKHKDLIGIPWRVAFALQDDGWYLRSDIIWSKPNPMPESVTDRPTKAHEYLFLLAKSRRYWYDADAIKEPVVYGDHPRNGAPGPPVQAPGQPAQAGITKRRRSGNKVRKYRADAGGVQGDLQRSNQGYAFPWEDLNGKRNARSVWSILTEPSTEEHFARMPSELARRCIVAGCPPGGTVLDPFAGTGTTGRVALDNGNYFVLIELSPASMEIARRTLAQQSLLVAPAAV